MIACIGISLMGLAVIALVALGSLMVGNPLKDRDHEDYVLHENDQVK